MIFLSLFACTASDKDTTPSDTDAATDTAPPPCETNVLTGDLSEAVDGLTLSLCLADGWQSYTVPPEEGVPFIVSAFFANFDITPPDRDHTVEGEETEANVFAWNLADYDPWGTGEVESYVEAYRASEAEIDGVSFVSSSVETLELGGYPAYGFTEAVEGFEEQGHVYTGSTSIFVYLDLGDGWVIDLSGFMGEPHEIVIGEPTSIRDTWPGPLVTYWETLGAITFGPAP